MQPFEKLGAFYLGKTWDPQTRTVSDEPLLYDARDLTTHAVCVGMTGSGKTGLGISLLEEAAIDGIPALVIDPKGDLGNLLLTFPALSPADFRPWIDEAEAARAGRTLDEHAVDVAARWRRGLEEWGQDGERIARFRDAAETAIYTPGSNAGLPLTVLGALRAPPPALVQDADALRERVGAAVSALLALVGIDADPLRSREHILLASLVHRSWSEGRDVDLPGLIREIQTPPFETVGILKLESFFPSGERFALAMRLNNLLASPDFGAWMAGDPLDVGRLLFTPRGKPRLAVFSIAHLADAERMFFVTLLLNEVVAWMRMQTGTASLRALLYMDEIFGYFPPSAQPPSKLPMLTLLKQARAYGLGVVLATQNPVDLDYKGLSNTGTWFLGRLQTERDKARVLDGLEGASAGTGFDRRELDRTLSSLDTRVFLMNNVHEDRPVLFRTRQALSYLRGPLTRAQIQTLAEPLKRERAVATGTPPADGRSPAPAPVPPAGAPFAGRPVLPAGVSEHFLPVRTGGGPGDPLLYRPALAGTARLHFVDSKLGVDVWETVSLLAPLGESAPAEPWEGATVQEGGEGVLEREGLPGAEFAALPEEAARAASYARFARDLAAHLYRGRVRTLWRCRELSATSEPGESEGDFLARLRHRAHEARDLEMEQLRKRHAPVLARLEERVRSAEQRVSREQAQYDGQKVQTAISLGATVLGALFGRKLGSVGNVGRATTAVRGAGRAAREKDDVARAGAGLEEAQAKLAEAQAEFQQTAARLQAAVDPASLALEKIELRPRKSDIAVTRVVLVWTPWRRTPQGTAEPAFG